MYAYAHFDGRGASITPDDAAGAAYLYPGPTSATLSVIRSGAGSGTVTSNPAGIVCGTDCAQSYPINTRVTLTAIPAAGSAFAGWSGACTGTGACAVTVSAATSVTATFTRATTPGGLSVSFTSPAAGATVSGAVAVNIWVAGHTGTANTFTLTAGGVRVASQTLAGNHATIVWNTATWANGQQTLVATVADVTGKTGTTSRTVSVQNAAAPPSTVTASFTAPAAGATVRGTTTVGMAAAGVTGATTFTLTIDGVTASTRTVNGTSASYAWNTTQVIDGPHTLGLTVTDSAGRTAHATRAVTVANATPTPGALSVSYTSPAAGATVSGSVAVNVWVSGQTGTANTFTLTAGGRVVATQTLAGNHATFTWNTTTWTNGAQALVATVRDATGKTGTASRTVTVQNGAPPAPGPGALSVSFTSPLASATVSGTVAVNVWVSGQTGTSNTFALTVGGRVVGTQTLTGGHATFSWDTRTSGNGAATLTATVRDASGKTGTASRAVTVRN
jgi:hypothetical protein